MDNFDVGQFILYMVALIFSLSVHEAGHAWMSSRFGDDLARSQGRVSINPMTHVDPIGTLLFPAMAFVTGAPLLGWARPVPVNPLSWRDRRVANFWVSLAGIINNLIVALVAGIIIRALYESSVVDFGGRGLMPATTDSVMAVGAVNLLTALFTMNVGLGVFNLLPIPPLDGSKILASILPERFESAIESLEQFGFILLFIAVFTGVFRVIFGVVIPFAWSVVFVGA